MTNEAELQDREQQFLFRQHAYELTQKLTYFVISVELIFCGYMLLNADKLKGIKSASFLFLAAGIAALLGILWRFFYNQTYHNNAHQIKGVVHRASAWLQIITYWLYITFSIAAFIWALIAGFIYLDNISHIPPPTALHQKNLPQASPARPKTDEHKPEAKTSPVSVTQEQKNLPRQSGTHSP